MQIAKPVAKSVDIPPSGEVSELERRWRLHQHPFSSVRWFSAQIVPVASSSPVTRGAFTFCWGPRGGFVCRAEGQKRAGGMAPAVARPAWPRGLASGTTPSAACASLVELRTLVDARQTPVSCHRAHAIVGEIAKAPKLRIDVARLWAIRYPMAGPCLPDPKSIARHALTERRCCETARLGLAAG